MDDVSMPIATECRSGVSSFRDQNIHVISTTFVVYNPKLGGVRDKTVGDTGISGYLSIWRKECSEK
jgi:hypothetical protein